MVLRLLIIAGLLAFPLVAVAQTTTGAVHVLARDEANAVLSEVRIVLDGPVLQQSATDGKGVAVFDRVPAGTYQLVATLTGWINQRVGITVSPGSTTSQQLTLRLGAATGTGYSKPVRDRIVTSGCNLVDLPESLTGFVERADTIAQIRVREQEVESRIPPRTTRQEIITRSTLEVLAVFKRHALWPVQGRAEIGQLGGDVDRGSDLERVRHHGHEPLTVGREYVVFLERSKWPGRWAILFGNDGAFLTNGPQREPLGAGEFAPAGGPDPLRTCLQHSRSSDNQLRPWS